MEKYSKVFVAFDTARKKHAVAIAGVGREGEIRFLGAIDSSSATAEKLIGKLARRYEKLHVCYEAGPTGYGLYRQVRAVGHEPDGVFRPLVSTGAVPSDKDHQNPIRACAAARN